MQSFEEEENWHTNALDLAKKFNHNFKKFKLINSDLINRYSTFGPRI